MKNTALVLPAHCSSVLNVVIDPALRLLPSKMTSNEARTLTAATSKQESGLRTRVQDGGGPAHGLWQFEEGGAVKGVLNHEASRNYALSICNLRGVLPEKHAVWVELPNDDTLAACFARLLLYTAPTALPTLGDVDAAWEYYLDNWRPGKPRKETWAGNYAEALRAVTGQEP